MLKKIAAAVVSALAAAILLALDFLDRLIGPPTDPEG